MHPEGLPVIVNEHTQIHFRLSPAKRVIALKWRETQGPTSAQWITELSNLALEKLTKMVKGKQRTFTRCGLRSYDVCQEEECESRNKLWTKKKSGAVLF